MPLRQRSLRDPDQAFQSAPGLTVGRCAVDRDRGASGNGFQSAPGLTVGRCAKIAEILDRDPLVSIRARPHGRAMRTPDPGADLPKTVSIRARPHGRAMLFGLNPPLCALAFQSAPGLTVGRCTAGPIIKNAMMLFQSAPGLTVGRCNTPGCTVEAAAKVSIRARPHGRAMRRKRGTFFDSASFNPRPASRSGDARWPAPPQPAAPRFNPRPASRSGDARIGPVGAAGVDCFNPRPASRSGDA